MTDILQRKEETPGMDPEERPCEDTARSANWEKTQEKQPPADTLTLDVQPPDHEEINFCLLSHSVCGVLLW